MRKYIVPEYKSALKQGKKLAIDFAIYEAKFSL